MLIFGTKKTSLWTSLCNENQKKKKKRNTVNNKLNILSIGLIIPTSNVSIQAAISDWTIKFRVPTIKTKHFLKKKF